MDLVTALAPPLGATVAGVVAGATLSLADPADAAWLLLLWPVTGLVTDGVMAVAGRSRPALVAAVTAGVSAATVLDDVLTVGLPALPASPLAPVAIHCPAVSVHCTRPPTRWGG